MGALCTSSTNHNTTYNTQPLEPKRNNADLVNVIPIYDFIYHDKYAKFMKIRQNQLSNIEAEFGDIIEIINPSQYAHRIPVVVGANNEFLPCFDVSDTENMDIVTIPFQICHELDNPVAFYSKLIKNDDENLWQLTVKNDDKYIIHRFGGPLSPKYGNIKLQFKYGKLYRFNIIFDGIGEKIFDTESWNYSNEDIDEFYEIRTGSILNKKHETNLVIMEIASIDYNLCKTTIKAFPSSKWEYLFKEFNEYGEHFWREYLIGPRDEEQKMINLLQRQYNLNKIKYWTHSVDNYYVKTQITHLPYTISGGYYN